MNRFIILSLVALSMSFSLVAKPKSSNGSNVNNNTQDDSILWGVELSDLNDNRYKAELLAARESGMSFRVYKHYIKIGQDVAWGKPVKESAVQWFNKTQKELSKRTAEILQNEYEGKINAMGFPESICPNK
jgi:hypothetical protein